MHVVHHARLIVLVPIISWLASSGCGGDDRQGIVDGIGWDDDVLLDDVFPDLSPGDLTPPPSDTSNVCSEPGGFLCSCNENVDCNSTLCVPSRDGGKVCSQTCIETCPEGWACRPVSLGGADTTFICVDRQLDLCRPCAAQSDCQTPGFSDPEDRCVDFGSGEGAFCAIACPAVGEDSACPAGYTCAEVPSLGSEEVTTQCVPADRICACSGRAIEQRATTACSDGPCDGERVCAAEGLTACDAPEPSNELCDGLDNDCSGLTDEGFPDLDRDGDADCIDEDRDGDDVLDSNDNCPELANADQQDTDNDSRGDACDPPEAPLLLQVTPPSPANENAPVLSGNTRANHIVTLYADPACATAVATTTATGDGAFAVAATVADDSTTTFRARAANLGGLASECSATAIVYVEDSTPPAAPSFVGTTPGSPSQTITNPIVTGLAEPLSRVMLYTHDDCGGEPAATTETGTQGVFLASVSVTEGSSTTFFATATDAAGNTGPCSPQGIVYTHIAGPIDTFLTSGPSDPSTSTTATFWFIASVAEASFRCRLDGAPFAACTSPLTYANLAAGAHRFEVVAVNAAGQADPTPAVFAWSIDTGPPHTTLTRVPADPSNVAAPTFSFAVSEADATTVCRIDSGPFVACTSPWQAPGLADGFHTIYLLSTDAAGNQEPVPASYRWRIDTAPPDTTLVPSDTRAVINVQQLSLAPTSTEAGTFRCTLDGVDLPCPSVPGRIDLNGLADGAHQLVVTAVDEAGNADPSPARWDFAVDATPPETSFVGNLPPNISSTTAVTIDFTSNDAAATFECSLAGASYTTCTSPWSATLGAGVWTFAVRAVDVAGNRDPTPASVTFGIDNAPPDTVITAHPPSLTRVRTPGFAFMSPAIDVTGFLCWLDGDGPFDCTSPWQASELDDGMHTFEVAAYDAVNNIDPTPAIRFFTIDSVPPPAPTITSATAGNRRIDVTWSAIEDAVRYELRWGPTPAGATLPSSTQITGTSHTITGLLNCSEYVVEVVAIDAAGNISAPSARVAATPFLPVPDSLVVGGHGIVAVRWSQVANASAYRIRYRANPNGAWDGVGAFEGDSPIDAAANASLPFELKGLPADRTVEVMVVAVDGTCESAAGTVHRTDPYPWDWVSPGPTGNSLRAVRCVGERCLAVGQVGTVLTRADAAAAWVRGNGGTDEAFVSLAHASAEVAVAIAGRSIHRTTDGGAIFRRIFTAPGTLARASLVGNTGWAVGQGGRIFKTTDGGATWSEQTSNTSGDLSAVHAVSDTAAWAAGAGGTLLRTTDGSTWQAVDGPLLDRIFDLVCSDAVTCWGVGAAGAIIRTTNGTTWTTLASRPTNQTLHAVSRSAAGVLRAVGANNLVLRSNDSGASWQSFSGGAPVSSDQIFGLTHVGETALLVGEKGHLARMASSGANEPVQLIGSTLAAGDLRAVAQSGDGPLVVAGAGGLHRLDPVARTLTNLATTTGTMRAIGFGSNGFGLAVGDSGAARKTVDHGVTWTTVDPGLNEELRAVACVDTTTCWVAGSGSIVRRTTDAGANWAPRAGVSGTRALRFFDAQNGFIAIDNSFAGGSNYTGALFSVDGGTNWTSFLTYSNGRAIAGTSIDAAAWVGGGGSNWCVEKAGLATQGGGESGAIFMRNSNGQRVQVHSAGVDFQGDCFLAATERSGGILYAGGTQGLLSRDVPAPFGWTQMPPPTRERDIFGLREITPGRVVAVGERGLVLVSDTGGL